MSEVARTQAGRCRDACELTKSTVAYLRRAAPVAIPSLAALLPLNHVLRFLLEQSESRVNVSRLSPELLCPGRYAPWEFRPLCGASGTGGDAPGCHFCRLPDPVRYICLGRCRWKSEGAQQQSTWTTFITPVCRCSFGCHPLSHRTRSPISRLEAFVRQASLVSTHLFALPSPLSSLRGRSSTAARSVPRQWPPPPSRASSQRPKWGSA